MNVNCAIVEEGVTVAVVLEEVEVLLVVSGVPLYVVAFVVISSLHFCNSYAFWCMISFVFVFIFQFLVCQEQEEWLVC